ncbi:TPA: 50S ribosomal protein L19 [candidate division WWE3 bacterium]|uniref:Large ribosomal subunit protein bL19 n=1 Tax=candidate division WWE3 bacterium TaxID=2053526 RepID=A0A656PND6_UNCKA|nr:ribosomal protein L19 [candidate division WWE3 bacterium RAAC2_WWE3_1]KKS29890.1 MAG: 50S ribosomal protein L19 [candidate division WWE3 bacterium GW2011_GWB1_42_117]KKS55315.1 MAG: 50S ribosomal protein L19 [candidate division WWE3 bacterium GW2011_GWD2_42_34]KKT05868.1 MAG: 50S ribosomal protein L19 [candidate division WWE3 bacterium GW2011_GWE2_43_18]KKT07242.1 MAG: 50S ribosomal protein L19 [candidate division WWE3 bacterium GW2011_GWF2_43_18]KKT09110.1 MAG: 50S ribosomal protein L19 [c
MADKDQDTTKQDDTAQQDEPVDESIVEASAQEEEAAEAPAVETEEEKLVEVIEEKAEEESKAAEEELKKVSEEEPKIPEFRVGDTIRVFYKIIEGEKMRIQPFEGIVISFRGSGVSKTFTVRRIGADQVGVERILPLFSPNIEKIKVVKHGNVRRAKLFYLRNKVGREAMRVREAKK